MINEEYKELLRKRFQTTMIGAIFEFEKAFGYLWGQDKNPDFLTEIEDDFRYRWENVRNQILNNGNSQLRKCLVDLENINGDNKYHYKFYKKGNKRNED
jgi:hypothetical protein